MIIHMHATSFFLVAGDRTVYAVVVYIMDMVHTIHYYYR